MHPTFRWDFNFYSDQLLAFLNGLRQAAVDGKIVLEGRLGLHGGFADAENEITRGYHPLEPIPAAHIKTFWINTPHMPRRQQNWRTHTYLPGGDRSRECFVDNHVSSSSGLREWLASSVSLQGPQPDEDLEDAMAAIIAKDHFSPEFVKKSVEDGARRQAFTLFGCSCMGDNWVAMGHDPISARYWQEGGIIDLATFDFSENRSMAPRRKKQATSTSEQESFQNLRVNRKAFSDFWTAIEEVA